MMPASLFWGRPPGYHGEHRWKGDALSQALNDPDYVEEGEAGVGRQGGDQGEDCGYQDP